MLGFRTIAAAMALSFLLVAPAHAADETRVDLRLSIGVDIVNAPGSVLISGRYGGSWGVKAGFWAYHDHIQEGAPNALAGVDRIWTYGAWRAGFGVVWIDRVNKLNGTHPDFDLSLAYDLSKRVSLEFRHFSHGGMLGIDRTAPNRGWNLIGVGLIF